MAWAPNYNDYKVVGCFRNSETDAFFEYDKDPAWKPEDGLFGIFMSDGTKRSAKILKTVAYVAVDEDAYGNPVWEKWKIKNHKMY